MKSISVDSVISLVKDFDNLLITKEASNIAQGVAYSDDSTVYGVLSRKKIQIN